MPDELEARVSALEAEMKDLRARVAHSAQDSAAARILAGAADRDVDEVRTELREFRNESREFHSDMTDFKSEMRDFRTQNNRTLNAMREDIVDLRRDAADLREHVDRGFAEMRGRFDGVAAGMQTIADLIGGQIDKDDKQS